MKTLLWWLVPPWLGYGQKSGNASDSDAQLWWSAPGVACEPVVPAPAMMRTDGPRWARGRRKALGDLSQRNHLDMLPAPVGSPGAAKSAAWHIHPPCRCLESSLRRDLQRRGQEAANSTDATSTIASGSSPQTLLTEHTFLAVIQRGYVNGSLS